MRSLEQAFSQYPVQTLTQAFGVRMIIIALCCADNRCCCLLDVYSTTSRTLAQPYAHSSVQALVSQSLDVASQNNCCMTEHFQDTTQMLSKM